MYFFCLALRYIPQELLLDTNWFRDIDGPAHMVKYSLKISFILLIIAIIFQYFSFI